MNVIDRMILQINRRMPLACLLALSACATAFAQAGSSEGEPPPDTVESKGHRFDHPGIIAAYNMAREAGIYEEVLLYDGERVRHYGLTNDKEYFAEGTEAFFYRNDFFPFVRAELKEHDPDLHDLVVEIW